MNVFINIIISTIFVWNTLRVDPMCKCNADPPFYEVATNCPLVVIGEVVEYENNSSPQFMNVMIKSILKGNDEQKVIKVWGDDGKSCKPYVSQFPKNSTWVFALHKENDNDYYISICGQYWLAVKGENASGIINTVGEQKTISLQALGDLFVQVPFRDSYHGFTESMSKVRKGWTEKKLLEHAGEPDYKEEKVWSYRFQEGGLGCVRYSYYEFSFQKGKIIDIQTGGGHKIIQ